MSDTNTPDSQVAADLAILSVKAEPIIPGTPVHIKLPQGATTRTIDGEALLPEPSRSRGTVRPSTVDALVSYCAEHNAGTTEVWITTERIVAVLDGKVDGNTAVGWGHHRAELLLAKSPEWRHWQKLDGQMVGQADLAEHVEDGLLDIVAPESSAMLEVVKDLQVSRQASFRSSVKLGSGEIGFAYDEKDTTKAGAGQSLSIPTEFELGIPVFEGEAAYKVKCRFRYRMKDGVLHLGYKIERPDLIERDAAEQIASRLRGEPGEQIEDAAHPSSTLELMPFAAVYAGTPGEPVKAGLLS